MEPDAPGQLETTSRFGFGRDLGEEPVPFGEGRLIWPSYWMMINRDDWPGIAKIDVRVIDGRPRCVKFTVTQREGGPPITNLRRVSLPLLMEAGVANAVIPWPDPTVDPMVAGLHQVFGDRDTDEAHQTRTGAVDRVRRARGRPPISDEVRTRVLELWAELEGQPKRFDRVKRQLRNEGLKPPSKTKVYEIVKEGAD